ncbi:prepilin-type N-terminal cleavage/methylation domain-containing protein [Clostridium beijerinckii]|uniref:prepilin-type N-terminal cleavage/methylation domain-containing protein n=1 Tax=Clostridium beijerinckii TaxID=1520 RepID=UPI0002E063D5|nr:prepilin-type N-terminal cleavage/methylation domain-containing protein [Clostridium beijerinckii]
MTSLSIRKMNELSKKKKKGFTLVELIIVIAIIAILAAIAIPKFGQITKRSNITADIATAKNLSGITAQAVAENQDLLGTNSGTTTTKDAILDKLDGGTMPTSKVTKVELYVDISSDGDITISSGATGDEIYPKPEGDFAS